MKARTVLDMRDDPPAENVASTDFYPPISDNRYKGLMYWWTFAELRADPDQISRLVDVW